MSGASVSVAGRKLALSNLQKVLYPASGFTKAQVIDYYLKVAPALLPHLAGRPLTLKRYPNGVDAPFFYEKRCPPHRPDWVPTASLFSRHQADVDYCVIDGLPALIWVANLASLELHVLLSKAADIDRPTMVMFDLDPGPPADILACVAVAVHLRELLRGRKLQSFVKTSGGKGLHLCVPLNTPATFDRTKDFARSMALGLERDHPAHVTSVMRKDLRPGKVFVDWSQNDRHKTTVCAYSLRAQEGPTVSAPLKWTELESALKRRDGGRLRMEATQVTARIKKLGDLFAPVQELRQRL